jgi:predicted permease
MTEILTLLIPFFGLIALGYGAGRLGFVTAEGAGGLDFFVLYLALPAFFFQSIASGPAIELGALSFVLTTTFATYCAFAIAFSIGALFNGGNVPEATIQGLAGSCSNTAYLAPALVVVAFGGAAAVPTALIFSFDNALLAVVTPLMMALGGTMRANRAKLVEEIARNVFLHPIVIATALGLVVAAVGIEIPSPVDAALTFLRHVAAPGALFVLGLAAALRPLGELTWEMPAIVIVKLIAQPLIVYLLLSWVGGFDPAWVKTAVLLAALPPAMRVLSVAQHYRIYAARASTVILVTMGISAVSVTVLLVLLVNNVLPSDPFR